MKNYIYTKLLLLTAALMNVLMVEGAIRHIAEIPEVEIMDADMVGERAFVKIAADGLMSVGNPGEPSLPVMHLKFSVPYNAYDFTVDAVGTVDSEVILPVDILPVQKSVPAKYTAETIEFTMPDIAIYGKSEFYPAELAYVSGEGFLAGENHIVTVSVYAADYNPISKKLRKYSSVVVELGYRVGASKSALKAVFRPAEIDRTADFELVEKLVVNPLQAARFAAPGRTVTMKTQTVTTSLPAYEYCVVTSRKLAPAFNRLISWKMQKGYDAGVVCIEDILADAAFANGDVVSGINDDAGKLREYLRYTYEEKGVGKYVLLAGDYTVIPIRYGYKNVNVKPVSKVIPTDSYFCDFNGDWDVDGDGFFGEDIGDKVDFYPEIYVGRLLCTKPEEIANYTEKLLRYERNPGNGDYGYLKRGFISQSDGMQYSDEARTVAENFNPLVTEFTIFSEKPTWDAKYPTFPTGNQCIEEMNKHYGFFGWHGHGQPYGIAVKSYGDNNGYWYAVIARQGLPNNHINESKHGLDMLTNFDYTAIAYSVSCDVTPFDIFDGYNVEYNMGSSFTVGGLYGGPAFLGNTRSGWYSIGGNGPSVTLEEHFIYQLKRKMFNIGMAEVLSKIEPISGKYSHYVKLTHNLIGEPEFEMWTDIPKSLSGTLLKRTDKTVQVMGGNELVGSTVGVSSLKYRFEVTHKYNPNGNCTFRTADKNCIVTVYKHDYIPYTLPIVLQNDSISNVRRHLFSDYFSVGADIDKFRTSGSYVFGKGSDIIVEVKMGASLFDGFKVEDGAKVTIKSEGTVTVYGGEIAKGGELEIIAPDVKIIKSFSTEKGAIVKITNKK